MGNNWTLLLGDRQIRIGKNETPAKLMTVFREEDKYQHLEWARRVDEVNARGEAAWDELDEFEGFNHRELFGYRTTVQTIMTRLKLMGFDPDRCSQEMIKDLEGVNEDDIEDGLLVLRRPARERKQEIYHRVSAAEVLATGITACLKRAEAFGNWKKGDDRPGIPRACLALRRDRTRGASF
ncbi:hypothetical protein ACFRNJ_18400 [Streptomyces sp. NPDC056721]|uniref:hypothetical protein n=1 Tax=Streptomyces sp. NPDC056721 TaxID=3345923 RepID=UPI0036C79FC4